jgi:hypothetical protein
MEFIGILVVYFVIFFNGFYQVYDLRHADLKEGEFEYEREIPLSEVDIVSMVSGTIDLEKYCPEGRLVEVMFQRHVLRKVVCRKKSEMSTDN